MKILTINTRYIGGGGAASIANLLHHSINESSEMSSMFLYGRGFSDDCNSIKIAKEYESYISAGVTRVLGRELNKGLSNIIKKEIDNSDIIHLHNLHGYYINYEQLIDYIVEKDKKIIWTLHDTWCFTGRCAFTFGCDKWKYGCGNCPNKKVYPATNIDISNKLWIKKKKIFNKINKEKVIFITPSIWMQKLVKESFLKGYPVEVINNGVEESKFKLSDKNAIRKELNLPIDKKIVLFVAADPNDNRKGIKYILELLNKVNDDIVFVSMGKSIDINSEKLIQLGYKSNRDDIYKIYRASDVFVIPSLDDNFPTTVIEAFANGIPVVGFNTGGIKEQIINGINGFITENKTSAELLEKINLVLEKQNKKEITEFDILNNFHNKYTLEIFKNSYRNIYINFDDIARRSYEIITYNNFYV